MARLSNVRVPYYALHGSPAAGNASPKKGVPQKPKQVVSAAGVFKNRSTKPKAKSSRLSNAKAMEALLAQKAVNEKAATKPVEEVSISPVEKRASAGGAGGEQGREKEKDERTETHPICVMFNDVIKTYRQSELSQWTATLEERHTELLQEIHLKYAVPVPASSEPSSSGQQFISFPVAYRQRIAPYVAPLGGTLLKVTATGPNGEVEETTCTFDNRMKAFMEKVKQKEDKMKTLKRDWEVITNEIWWVGVQVLGEEAMRGLLELKGDVEEEESPDVESGKRIDAKVGEEMSASEKKKEKGREKDKAKEGAKASAVVFKPRPSRLKPALKPLPRMSAKQVRDLVVRVENMGAEALEEMMRLEKEGVKEWAAKQKKILNVLNE